MDVARLVRARKGKVSSVSSAQPPLPVTTTPDVSEELTMTRNTRKSFTPWIVAFSAGLWASVRSVVCRARRRRRAEEAPRGAAAGPCRSRSA